MSIQSNGSNSSLFVNTTNICQFKAKDSEMKHYSLWFCNVSKDFSINNIKNRIKLKLNIFYVDCNPIDTNDIFYVHRYLMKRT